MSQDYMEVDIFVKYLLAHIYNAIHTGSKVIVKRHRFYQLYLSAGFVTFPEYLPTYLPTTYLETWGKIDLIVLTA